MNRKDSVNKELGEIMLTAVRHKPKTVTTLERYCLRPITNLSDMTV